MLTIHVACGDNQNWFIFLYFFIYGHTSHYSYHLIFKSVIPKLFGAVIRFWMRMSTLPFTKKKIAAVSNKMRFVLAGNPLKGEFPNWSHQRQVCSIASKLSNSLSWEKKKLTS
jgi:hypothetical protein